MRPDNAEKIAFQGLVFGALRVASWKVPLRWSAVFHWQETCCVCIIHYTCNFQSDFPSRGENRTEVGCVKHKADELGLREVEPVNVGYDDDGCESLMQAN